MNDLILKIYGTPEDELKTLVLNVSAEEVKAAAKALGIEKAANDKPVDQASKFDLALAIKAVEQSVVDDVTAAAPPAPPEQPPAGGPSVAQPPATPEPPAPPEQPPVDDDDPVAEQNDVVLALRKSLKRETAKLNAMIKERAASEHTPSQHELLTMVKESQAKRDAEADDYDYE